MVRGGGEVWELKLRGSGISGCLSPQEELSHSLLPPVVRSGKFNLHISDLPPDLRVQGVRDTSEIWLLRNDLDCDDKDHD